MTQSSRARGAVLTLVPALLLLGAFPSLAAEIDGQVLGPAGVTPITNATVTFYNLTSRSTYNSEPTGSDGAYALTDLPEGRYDVAVQTDRGLWLVDAPLTVAAGETRTLSFSLRELAYWEGMESPPERAIPPDESIVGRAVMLDTSSTAPPPPAGRKRKIWTGVGVGLGVLALALWAGDNEASPFTP